MKKMSCGPHFINDPNNYVEESLEGLVIGNPGTVKLSGRRIITRADWKSRKNNEVAVISGGGFGHGPAFAGYVGKSMLTAAVCGEVFTSPTMDDILTAIREVTGVKGCAVIVMNYTGDRLNFGLAVERAIREGLNVRIIAVVADDCALPREKGITGRRGVAGTILALKVACAAAADGADLDQIENETNDAINSMASMGCALNACTLPGEPINTRLMNSKTMEFGLGIHGEPGTEIQPVLSADDSVDKLMHAITGPPNCYLLLDANERVVILVNSLGATAGTQLNILLRRAMDWAHQRGIIVERCCAGYFMTSLDMAGASITVMKVNKQQLRRLDAYCVLSLDDVESFIRRIAETICDVEPELTKLDVVAGDGDCGRNFKAAAERLIESLDKGMYDASRRDDSSYLMHFINENGVSGMGGTCGAILQIFLLEADCCIMRGDLWPDVVEHGVKKIMMYGGASVGMKTLLDALVPFKNALKEGKGLKEAAEEARFGVESTRGMEALAGRSNYVYSSTPVADAGAVAVAHIISSIAESLDP